jgi:glyoxylase-like metal-dependent hydrolase (beta-lactamase superfamily II)
LTPWPLEPLKEFQMNIVEARPKLYLLELEQEMKGYKKCIGPWFYNGEHKFLVDVGPKVSAEKLLKSLEALNVQRLDFIFLTHIHIDHAGAIGILSDHFPAAKVICHDSSVKHLLDTQKLWEESKRVLREKALYYGPIDPVSLNRIIPSSKFALDGFRVIDTPGHAPHHISLIYNSYLFAGEAAGFFQDMGNDFHLRPVVFPGFSFERMIASIDRMIEADPREICYAHFGMHPDAKGMLKKHKDQLYLWQDIITEQLKRQPREKIIERCISAILEKDDLLKHMNRFDEDEKKRELFFIQKSVEGYLGYLVP